MLFHAQRLTLAMQGSKVVGRVEEPNLKTRMELASGRSVPETGNRLGGPPALACQTDAPKPCRVLGYGQLGFPSRIAFCPGGGLPKQDWEDIRMICHDIDNSCSSDGRQSTGEHSWERLGRYTITEDSLPVESCDAGNGVYACADGVWICDLGEAIALAQVNSRATESHGAQQTTPIIEGAEYAVPDTAAGQMVPTTFENSVVTDNGLMLFLDEVQESFPTAHEPSEYDISDEELSRLASELLGSNAHCPRSSSAVEERNVVDFVIEGSLW